MNVVRHLIETYDTFGKPVDRIAAFLPLRSEFLARLPGRPEGPDGDAIVWRLLQLRKMGKLSKGRTQED